MAEVVIPLPAEIHYTANSPTYLRSAWAASQSYTAGVSFVRHTVDGVLSDFVAMVTHTSTASNSPYRNNGHWRRIGRSAISSSVNYTKNVDESLGTAWVSGAAVTAGTLVYDYAVRRDFIAAIDLSSGENTIRPGDAQYSTDPAIAARWLDHGASNLFSVVDYGSGEKLIVSRMIGINVADELVNPVFEVTAAGDVIDRVCLTGLVNIKTIQLMVYLDGSLSETKTITLTPSGTAFGFTKKSASIAVTEIPTNKVAVFMINATRNAATSAAEIGRVVIGRAYSFGLTHWTVETSILSFSRKFRDPTFGTVTLTPRPSARQLRATCSIKPETVAGDIVQQGMEYLDGRLAFWDFNNSGVDYDRLRLFGFFDSFGLVIRTPQHEVMLVTIEGIAGL